MLRPARLLPLAVLLIGLPVAGQVSDLGQITFSTSAQSDEAEAKFIEGTLLLHSFEYEDAAEAFREAQALEPDFAMAYWGEAMTHNHPIWYQSDPDEAHEALNRLAPTPEARQAKAPTDREKAYLQAVEVLFGEGGHLERNRAYAGVMAELAARYPDDMEAQAFHALAVLGTSNPSREIPIYMRAAAIAEEIYEDHPRHPGALHYLIHAYDDPVHAPLGLRAARRYAEVAPAASHALHMPSHIFVALGMWEDVVSSNIASSAAAEARRQRKDLDLNARGYHALWWLLYGYMQQDRLADARKLLDQMEDDYRNRPDGTSRIPFHLIVMRASYLIDGEQWKDDITVDIDEDDLNLSMAMAYYLTNGLKAYHLDDREELEAARSALRDHLSEEDPSTSSPAVQAARVAVRELDALALYMDGKIEEALDVLRGAALLEEDMSFMFGPPRIVKPSHELLGELLLEQGNEAEAREAFEAALARAPKRKLALRGLGKTTG